MLEVWKIDPAFTVTNLINSRLVDEVISRVPSLEGVILLSEVLYFRAAEFIKQEKIDIAREIFEEAFRILSSLMRVEQLERPSIIVGQLDNVMVKETIIRIITQLNSSGNIELISERIEKIKLWFRRTFDENSDF